MNGRVVSRHQSRDFCEAAPRTGFPLNHVGLLLLLMVLCLSVLTSTSCVFRSITESKPESVEPIPGYGSVGKLPFKEAYYGSYFLEDKVGYSHLKIEPAGVNFSLLNESLVLLTVKDKTDELSLKQNVIVRPDLSMVSLDSVAGENGKELHLVGKTEGNRFMLEITKDGLKKDFEFPVDGKIYHSNAITLMPAMRGVKNGAHYTFKVLNEKKQALEEIDQRIMKVQGPPGPNGAVWQVKTTIDHATIFSWLDRKGLPVLEKALNGSLVTMLEDKKTAESFLKKKERLKQPKADIRPDQWFGKYQEQVVAKVERCRSGTDDWAL